MAKTLLAAFDDRSAIDDATHELEGMGVAKHRIRLEPGEPGRDAPRGATGLGDRVRALLGRERSPEEPRARAPREPATAVLAVDVDEAEVARVSVVLRAHGAGEIRSRAHARATRQDASGSNEASEPDSAADDPSLADDGARPQIITIREERIEVERRSVERPLLRGDEPFKEGTLELVEEEEQAIVSKQPLVVEEISIERKVHHKLRRRSAGSADDKKTGT
jgi:hypothetical protein